MGSSPARRSAPPLIRRVPSETQQRTGSLPLNQVRSPRASGGASAQGAGHAWRFRSASLCSQMSRPWQPSPGSSAIGLGTAVKHDPDTGPRCCPSDHSDHRDRRARFPSSPVAGETGPGGL